MSNRAGRTTAPSPWRDSTPFRCLGAAVATLGTAAGAALFDGVMVWAFGVIITVPFTILLAWSLVGVCTRERVPSRIDEDESQLIGRGRMLLIAIATLGVAATAVLTHWPMVGERPDVIDWSFVSDQSVAWLGWAGLGVVGACLGSAPPRLRAVAVLGSSLTLVLPLKLAIWRALFAEGAFVYGA